MTALVTRRHEDSAALVAALTARGIAALVEPMLDIQPSPDVAQILPPLLTGAQALLFTSANGVRAFAAANGRRDLAAYAVGDATAAAARDAGFAPVASAGGNVEDLARLVLARLRPAEGALVHAAGSVVAGDLATRLEAAGFAIHRAMLYRAVPATRFSAEGAAALASGCVDLALFFSPRTAEVFVSLTQAAGLAEACRGIAAIGLSPAVAASLQALPWRDIRSAASPTEAAIIMALDERQDLPA